jgi:hypothetical protein
MSSTSTHRTVLKLQVSFDDLVEAFTLAEPRYSLFPYPEHDVMFSCSSMGIWPTTRRGLMQDADRIYVQDKSWVLDAVAAIFRGSLSPRGGRFVLTLDGAVRVSDSTIICMFEVGA